MRPTMIFSLIAAASEDLGIGFQGNLPWRLKSELQYFNRMTTQVDDPSKKNVVIMGRKSYFGIPEQKRPLPNRLNIVLTRNSDLSLYPTEVVVCPSFEKALIKIQEPEIRNQIEKIWIIGGSEIYRMAMESESCHRIYFTEIKAKFECDAFFPEIDKTKFKLVTDPAVPTELQEENGIQYEYKIYENVLNHS